jgi:molybdopterin-binding protein
MVVGSLIARAVFLHEVRGTVRPRGDRPRKEGVMRYGARNHIQATVKGIKNGTVMSQVDLEVKGPVQMSSVLTQDSVKELELKPGDKVHVIVKAIHVLLVKE